MTHPDLCPYCRAPISPEQRQRINDAKADEPHADLTDEEYYERTSDAIHIANPLRPELTLCGLPVRRTPNVETFAPDMRVDHWAGCWTCNDEAWRLAWAGKVGEAA